MILNEVIEEKQIYLWLRGHMTRARLFIHHNFRKQVKVFPTNCKLLFFMPSKKKSKGFVVFHSFLNTNSSSHPSVLFFSILPPTKSHKVSCVGRVTTELHLPQRTHILTRNNKNRNEFAKTSFNISQQLALFA